MSSNPFEDFWKERQLAVNKTLVRKRLVELDRLLCNKCDRVFPRPAWLSSNSNFGTIVFNCPCGGQAILKGKTDPDKGEKEKDDQDGNKTSEAETLQEVREEDDQKAEGE